MTFRASWNIGIGRSQSFSFILCLVVGNTVTVLATRSIFPSRVGWAQPFFHEKGKYFEGDIILRSSQDWLKAGSNSARWNKAVIPYVVHPNIRVQGRQQIQAAMKDIESKTCVRFKVRRAERDYVSITNFQQGCFSYVGRSGGNQQLNLGPGCWHKTTVIHELVHAVGFWHEQSRQDRDKFITVQWRNIPRNFWKEFQKMPHLKNYGTMYDLRSVMHYSYKAFSSDGRRPSITTKTSYPWRLLGTGDKLGGLTVTDAFQINQMYDCPTEQKTNH